MKSEGLATAVCWRRLTVLAVFLWSVAANFSLFTFHSSLLHAQMQRGKASFYSKRATGSHTANGERLHHDSMTCAHRTLPFGTLLKVTNVANDSTVIVRVNDRGPYIRGRIIDLTWGAAKKLNMIMQGIATVIVEEAHRITFPLKAPPAKVEIPRLEVPTIELPDTLVAIWQEDQLIEHKTPTKKRKGK
jgi:rare lipoprotein A